LIDNRKVEKKKIREILLPWYHGTVPGTCIEVVPTEQVLSYMYSIQPYTHWYWWYTTPRPQQPYSFPDLTWGNKKLSSF
jgi:hypothetical protein